MCLGREKMNIAFKIDDVNPKEKFNLKDNKFELIKKLNEKYGLKFDLFIPANYEGKYDLRKHKEWCEFIKSVPFFNVNYHGLIHESFDPNLGSQELAGISSFEIDSRLKEMKLIFDECFGKDDKRIFKAPGWYIRPNHFIQLQQNGINHVSDMFIGQNPIVTYSNLILYPYTLSIENLHSNHYKNNLILQSHIEYGKSNRNALELCYERLCKYLDSLDNIQPIFMRDLIK